MQDENYWARRMIETGKTVDQLLYENDKDSLVELVLRLQAKVEWIEEELKGRP